MQFIYNILNKYYTQNHTYIQNQYLNGNLKKLDADLITRAQKRHYKSLRKQIRMTSIDYMMIEKKLFEAPEQFKAFACNMPYDVNLLLNTTKKLKKENADFIYTYEINDDGYEHIHFIVLAYQYNVSDIINYLKKRDIHIDTAGENNVFLNARQMFEKFKYITKCYRNISILKSSLRTISKAASKNKYIHHLLKLLSRNMDIRNYVRSSVNLNCEDKAYREQLEIRFDKKFDVLQFMNSDEIEDLLNHWQKKKVGMVCFNKFIDQVIKNNIILNTTSRLSETVLKSIEHFNQIYEKYFMNVRTLYLHCINSNKDREYLAYVLNSSYTITKDFKNEIY